MEVPRDLDGMADLYRGQGYEVTVNPGPDQLPAFVRGFRIDLLGRRGAEGVLVAVRKTRDEFTADTEMPRYAGVIAEQPGWRFDLAVLEGEHPKARDLRGASELSVDGVYRSIEQAGELGRLGFPQAAVVSAWAALEAAMRMRLRASGQSAGWRSSARQTLQELYSAGAFTLEEFQTVEEASRLRSQIVHGFNPEPVGRPEAELARLLGDVARRLVGESQPLKRTA